MTDLATKPAPGVELDQDLLDEATQQLGSSSRNAVINEALRRLVDQERAKRRAARDRLHRMHEEGVFDYSRLDDAE